MSNFEILDCYEADFLNERPARREEVFEIADREAGHTIGYATSEANARLIAAAPEMAELLERMENVIRFAVQESAGRIKREIVGGWAYHADEARALLAKIKGTTHA